ncbi:NAD(P)H-binding protein [Streptomyces sp. TRM S81-3]|uniref:NAD(P)H-binding protein n=1 Tax=Streptomyces griseicoloratus TaxID=2752516 RepID=A0A926L583_9ACTN|nr:NAD(P)H-binding protein [Streptomyces griseicoloratus]MBD0421816.1 NAD(P)H-binding protein [Streptomyces griseicoloratus]
MKLVVFGASGPTGRLTTEQALAQGHTVTAVTRRPDAFPLEHPLLHVTGADVHDPEAVEHAVAGQDAVVSTLGVPYGRAPVTVYSDGVTHIARAMTRHGVRRLVCVTSTVLFDVPAPGEGLLFRKVLEPFITRFVGRTVYDDMRRMEAVLAGSGHDWTVVRPAGLFDTEAVSDYRLAEARLPGRYTARSDLASALLRHAVGDLRGRHLRTFVDVRTTQGVPGLFAVLRKEAFG